MNALPMWVQPVVERLGWVLLHSCWQLPVVAAAYLAIRRLLQNHSAAVRYLAGCAAMAVMVAAPLLTTVVVDVDVTSPEIAPSDPGGLVFPPDQAAVGSTSAEVTSTVLTDRADRTSSRPVRDPTPEVTGSTGSRAWSTWFTEALKPSLPWLVAIWVLGVAVLAARQLGGWLMLCRLCHVDTLPVDAAVRGQFERLTQRLNVSRCVRLLCSTRVDVPSVIGHFRPAILLPVSILSGLSPREIEAILAHELAHIRRHDYLVNLIQSTVETLLFYHPAVWWISREIRREREHCCDDLAVSVCGDRIVYAQALTALEKTRSFSPVSAVAADGGSLLTRVRRIVGQTSSSTAADPTRVTWLAAASLLVLLTAVPSVLIGAASLSRTSDQPQTPDQVEKTTQATDLELEARIVGIDNEGPVRSSVTFWRLVNPDSSTESANVTENVGFDGLRHVWQDLTSGKTWAPIHHFSTGDRATKKELTPGEYRVTAFVGHGSPSMIAVSDPVVLDGSQQLTVVPLTIQDGPALKIHTVNAETGKPIEYSALRLIRSNGLPVVSWSGRWSIILTGDTYTFEHLAPGEYTLEVSKPAYRYGDRQYSSEQGPTKFQLVAGQNRQMTVKLKDVGPSEEEAKARWPWAVTGRVTDGNGQPLEGVEIRASCGIGTLMPTGLTVSDRRGEYLLRFGPGIRIHDESTGQWGAGHQAATIFASRPGYTEKNLCRHGGLTMADELPPEENNWRTKPDEVILPGEPRRLDFVMVPALRLEGQLVDQRGEPLVDQRVSLGGEQLPPSCSVLAQDTTDESGRFRFEGVPTDYAWQFSALGRTHPVSFTDSGLYRITLQHSLDAPYGLDLLRITSVIDPRGEEVRDRVVGDDPSVRPPVSEKQQEEGRDYLRRMAAACRDWIGPPRAAVQSYEYRFRLGDDPPKTFRVGDASQVRASMRQGISYYGTPHVLAARPEQVVFRQVEMDGETILLRFLLQDRVKFVAGNGVSGSWRGYFSTPLREGVLVLDKRTYRPLRTEVGDDVRESFSRYMDLGEGRFVPLAIRIEKGSMRWDWRFRCYQPGLWLFSESHSADDRGRGRLMAAITEVKVNDQPATPFFQDGTNAPSEPPAEEVQAAPPETR